MPIQVICRSSIDTLFHQKSKEVALSAGDQHGNTPLVRIFLFVPGLGNKYNKKRAAIHKLLPQFSFCILRNEKLNATVTFLSEMAAVTFLVPNKYPLTSEKLLLCRLHITLLLRHICTPQNDSKKSVIAYANEKINLSAFTYLYITKSAITSPVKSHNPTVAATPIRIDKLRFTGVQRKSECLSFVIAAMIFTS